MASPGYGNVQLASVTHMQDLGNVSLLTGMVVCQGIESHAYGSNPMYNYGISFFSLEQRQ